MKPVFFITILFVYLLAHIYVGIRIFQLVPAVWFLRAIVVLVITLGFSSLIFYFTLNDKMNIRMVGFFYTFGTSWMIAFLYLFLLVFFMDIFRIINYFAHLVSKETIAVIFHNNGVTSFIALGLVAFILIIGNFRYHNKKRSHITIQTDKIDAAMRIVGISDLHLGHTIKKKELSKWIEMINVEKPDIVLIAGDLIDNDIRALHHYSLDEDLQRLNAPLGVYASTGNHEYISGIKNSVAFFEKSGITLLRDSVAEINGLSIIGRDDYTHRHRKSLQHLAQNIDRETFSILLDHQPRHLDEAVENGIDFQFSGHTHRGQIFPFSLLVEKMFELSHGYLKKGDTHFYVSTGLGIWGGKFRIGTRSEYLVLDLVN